MSCAAECRKPRGRQAHCGVCHLTFSGVSVFDKHRRFASCDTTGMHVDRIGVWRSDGAYR